MLTVLEGFEVLVRNEGEEEVKDVIGRLKGLRPVRSCYLVLEGLLVGLLKGNPVDYFKKAAKMEDTTGIINFAIVVGGGEGENVLYVWSDILKEYVRSMMIII